MSVHRPRKRKAAIVLAVKDLRQLLCMAIALFAVFLGRPAPPPPPTSLSKLTSHGVVDLFGSFSAQQVSFPGVQFLLVSCTTSKCLQGCNLCRALHKSRFFAPMETAIFLEILSGDVSGIVVDVGANIGYFSMLSLALGREVIAAEPFPSSAAFLELSAALNGFEKLHLLRVGVGNRHTKEANVAQHSAGWGRNYLVADTGRSDEKHTTVKVQALEEIIGREETAILKVDVEGYEYEIFKDFSCAGTKVHNVIVEVKNFNTGQKKDMLRALMDRCGLTHAYNYWEPYNFGGPSQPMHITQVTFGPGEPDLQFEDFVLTSSPLDLNRLRNRLNGIYAHCAEQINKFT